MEVSLITGGAGFIGSHVAKHCLLLGHKVVVLDDLSGGFADHIPQGVEFVQGSITDHMLVNRLLTNSNLPMCIIWLPMLRRVVAFYSKI